MDESRITSVHQPGCRFQGGPSQVAKMTSGERGATVTVICGVSVAGAYLPPFMIFPEANGGQAGCPATVSRPRQWKQFDRCRTLSEVDGTCCSLHKCINAEVSPDCVGRASQPQYPG